MMGPVESSLQGRDAGSRVFSGTGRLVAGILALVLGMAPGILAEDPPPSDHPVKIYTWGGPWTGWDLWDNQGLLQTRTGDTEDTDWYPWGSDIGKMRDADVVYIQNHGGKITSHVIPFPLTVGKDYLLKDLGFPTDEYRGPSCILSWGCENGRKDLVEKYSRGLGVLKDSKTKVVIAPRVEVNPFTDAFQEAFFAEFAKGNVSAEEAARRAYDRWKKNFAGNDPPAFDALISIFGNGKLTLDDIRANLEVRDRMTPGEFVAVNQEQRNWYCTNRPRIETALPAPESLRKKPAMPESLVEYEKAADDLEMYWALRGKETEPLERFRKILGESVGRVPGGGELPDFLKASGMKTKPPGSGEALDAWRTEARRAALAWWLRALARNDGEDAARAVEHELPRLEGLDARLDETGKAVAAALREE